MVLTIAWISFSILALLTTALGVTTARTLITGKDESHIFFVLKGFVPWAILSTIALVLA